MASIHHKTSKSKEPRSDDSLRIDLSVLVNRQDYTNIERLKLYYATLGHKWDFTTNATVARLVNMSEKELRHARDPLVRKGFLESSNHGKAKNGHLKKKYRAARKKVALPTDAEFWAGVHGAHPLLRFASSTVPKGGMEPSNAPASRRETESALSTSSSGAASRPQRTSSILFALFRNHESWAALNSDFSRLLSDKEITGLTPSGIVKMVIAKVVGDREGKQTESEGALAQELVFQTLEMMLTKSDYKNIRSPESWLRSGLPDLLVEARASLRERARAAQTASATTSPARTVPKLTRDSIYEAYRAAYGAETLKVLSDHFGETDIRGVVENRWYSLRKITAPPNQILAVLNTAVNDVARLVKEDKAPLQTLGGSANMAHYMDCALGRAIDSMQ